MPLLHNDVNDKHRIRPAFENVLNSITTQLINIQDNCLDDGIRDTLEKIGRCTGSNRAYLITISEGGNRIGGYEWRDETRITRLQEFRGITLTDDFAFFSKSIMKDQFFFVSNSESLPVTARAEREALRREGLKSVLDVLIVRNDSPYGFIGLATTCEELEIDHDTVSLLKVAGELLINAICRKQMEERIRSKDKSLIYAQRIAKFGNWEFDVSKGSVSLSDTLLDLLGLPPGMRNMRLESCLFRLIPLREQKNIREIMGRIKATNLPFTREFEIRLPDETEQVLLVQGEPLLNECGKANRWTGTAHDITIQKVSERLIVESEKKYRTLFELASDAIFLMSEDVFIDCNHQTLAMFGCNRDDIIGSTPYRYSPYSQPDGSRSKKKALEKINLALSGTPQFFEWRHIRQDGTSFDGEVSLGRIRLKERTVLQAIVRDITIRKKVEMELIDSEKKYRYLFESTPAITLIIGGDNIIKDVNRAILKKFGYVKEDIIGRNYLDFVVENHRQKAIEGVESIGTDAHRVDEIDIYAKDRSRHTILFDSGGHFPCLDDSKQSGFLMHGVDITERKRAQDLLSKQEEQLFHASKMVSLGTLISGFGHEINNPNNYIRLNAQGLADYWRSIEDFFDSIENEREGITLGPIPLAEARVMINEMIQGVLEGSKRIEKLLTDLREFIRDRKGSLDQEVDMIAIIESSIKIVDPLIKKSTYSFEFSHDCMVPAVTGNSNQLEQVIINLLTNACQALQIPEQGIRVGVECDSSTNEVVILIEDEGIGIPEENINQITDPFFTTKRDQGGTGLGLSVTYRIIQDHKGKLSFSSVPDGGTKAFLRLPIAG